MLGGNGNSLGRMRATWERRRVQLALIVVQLGFAGYYVLSKVAMSDGVNLFVFAFYRDTLGALLLLPTGYLAERQLRTKASWRLCAYILLLGTIGIYMQQMSLLTGLKYTNASFASCIQTTIPVFTVIISIICRVEKVQVNRIDGLLKILGICSCVSGAVIASLYTGPIIIGEAPEEPFNAVHDSGSDGWLTKILLGFGVRYWQIGSMYLLTNSMSLGIMANLQVPTLRIFPAPISLAGVCNLVGAVWLFVTSCFTVSDLSAWNLFRPGILVCVVYAGTVAAALCMSLNAWAVYKGGPIMTQAHSPLQIVFAVILGFVFFNEAVFLGSLIGTVFILTGLYLVIWGKAHELTLMKTDASFNFVDGPLKQHLLS